MSNLKVKTIFLLQILALWGAGLGYCQSQAISCKELNKSIAAQSGKITIVDVRGFYDFEKSHIPGAVNAPYDGIEKANLPKEGTLVLYCASQQCPWSQLGAKTLEAAGYKNVKVLDGGITAWTASGFSLETATGIEKRNAVINIQGIPPSKLSKVLEDKTIGIIDTRSEKEFRIAHLPGAKNIPLDGLEAASATLSKDIEWVFYDSQAERAQAAARVLYGKGFKVKELSGGIQVWAAKKYPMEAGGQK